VALYHRIRPKYPTRNAEIVAGLREAAGAAPPVDPEMRAKRLVAEMAIQMALIHGGDWRVEYEPHQGFVLLSRRQKRRSG